VGRLISWLLDAIVLYMMFRTVARLLTGGETAQRRRAPSAGPQAKRPERVGGTLVRDPQCGTYIPEASAVRLPSGDHTLYFCSTACRDAYQRQT
jgi:YHS domain-containing protein